MRFFHILLVLSIIVASFTFSTAISSSRKKRTLSPILNTLRRYQKCLAKSCPPWNCQDDSAVIHGYCCNCPGSELDNVPIPCYPDVVCPPDPEPLCSDYDFMMDCCCTGP